MLELPLSSAEKCQVGRLRSPGSRRCCCSSQRQAMLSAPSPCQPVESVSQINEIDFEQAKGVLLAFLSLEGGTHTSC
eukprot:1162054-Pelagomonas_calceolata.AAC.7